MTYTFVSARYANAEHTAAEAVTVEAGSVAVSAVDRPDLWAAMLAWGEPVAYAPPPDPVPATISDRQFYQQLAAVGVISEAEALAAVKTGEIPETLNNFLLAVPEEQRFSVNMILSGATEFFRNHPLTDSVGLAYGMSAEMIDDFFRAAAAL